MDRTHALGQTGESQPRPGGWGRSGPGEAGAAGVLQVRMDPTEEEVFSKQLELQDIFQDPVPTLIHNFALFFLQSSPNHALQAHLKPSVPRWPGRKPACLSGGFAARVS